MQLQVFVWRSKVLVFSPDLLETRILLQRTWCWTHKSPTAKCRTFPCPTLCTIPIAAVASDLIATWPHKLKSLQIDCKPILSVAARTIAASSDSPLLNAKIPTVVDHAFTNWPLHSATPPTRDFLVETHPANFASPKTSMLLPSSVHGYLHAIRELDCVTSNSSEGNDIFRPWWSHFSQQFFHWEQKIWSVHGKKIEPGRYTLEQRQFFSSEEITFFLISSGGSCHFAALRYSLISLALGPPASSDPGVATRKHPSVPKPSWLERHAAGPGRSQSSSEEADRPWLWRPRAQRHDVAQLIRTLQQT